ncbi:hypothetical protein PIROE2DRAFT_25496, partial [Piromyces sp. E2]
IVNYLLEQKEIKLDVKDSKGRTPIFYAIIAQNEEIIVEYIFREISNYGEKILNIQDIDGKTALHYAAMSRNKDILNIFLQSEKIDYEIIDKN